MQIWAQVYPCLALHVVSQPCHVRWAEKQWPVHISAEYQTESHTTITREVLALSVATEGTGLLAIALDLDVCVVLVGLSSSSSAHTLFFTVEPNLDWAVLFMPLACSRYKRRTREDIVNPWNDRHRRRTLIVFTAHFAATDLSFPFS